MAGPRIDLLTRRVDASRPELRIRRAVTAHVRRWWVLPLQVLAFVAVAGVGATLLQGRGPLAVLLTAVVGGAAASVVGTRLTPTQVLAFSEGRAHVFATRWSWWGTRIGDYRAPLLGGELEFIGGGRVFDQWRLLGRPVRVLRVHRPLLDAFAG